MKKILGRKQNTPTEAVRNAIEHIEEYVTFEEVNAAREKTIEDILEVTAGKKVAMAWSGGKDSIVLADLCRQAGIDKAVFAYSKLEYPAFMTWVNEHVPEGCDMVCTGQDLEWLSKHQGMIFPQDARTLSQWYAIIQKNTYVRYQLKNGYDMIIAGHRRADGNVIGPDGHVRRNNGFDRYAPLANWPHELLFGYIHYYKLALPPIYDWKDGWRQGTHSWPARCNMKTPEQGYREVWEIDHTLIEQAAEVIPGAKAFLDNLGEEAGA